MAPHLAVQNISGITLNKIERLALVSDFAIDVLVQQPELINQLDEALQPLLLPSEFEADWPKILRRWRRAQSCRLIWRDCNGQNSVQETLEGSTWIAEQALSQAFNAILLSMQSVHGVVRAEDGAEQRMVVLGLGKLGGGELNFSSDVDLVYAYTGHGLSDGARPIAAETFFTRLGQRLSNLLDEVTADGFSHRVDLRLRPYGASGRLLLSFNAMEQYFQTSGRDWERYAWLKARPVAGDIAAGFLLLDTLKPFVYRRYLDFTAIDGLRDMKAKIEAEVLRRDMVDDLKLGRGGIREIEFFVQALQIIYGGRTKSLQLKGLLPALRRLRDESLITEQTESDLQAAYIFLRRLENRVQMIQDAQEHHLPADEKALQRIASGLDYGDSEALLAELNLHRKNVEQVFAGLLSGAAQAGAVDYNVSTPSINDLMLSEFGFQQAELHAERLAALLDSSAAMALSDRSQQRLSRVINAFCYGCRHAKNPDQCLAHAISFLQSTLKRSNYIALLDEQQSALNRVVQAFDESYWLSQQLIDHPMLLDELLDTRVIDQQFDMQALPRQIGKLCVQSDGDVEQLMLALNEFKISFIFKTAYHFLFQGLSAVNASRLLTLLAESILAQCNRVAAEQLAEQHGTVPGSSFAIIGYGSLGAGCLAFNSDLDLVFLNQTETQTSSDGKRPIDSARFFLRQAQKLISLLDLNTPSGSLYEVDIRLRPDGAKGLLVSTLQSFRQYQQQRAWTWELQAMVRARAVAGDAGLCQDFEALRADLLASMRDGDSLKQEIIAMRHRMRTELDRSNETHFDLKHGRGGLTDIEFFLQAQILLHANQYPELTHKRDSLEMLEALRDLKLIVTVHAEILDAAYQYFMDAGLRCHLNNTRRVVMRCAELSSFAECVTIVLAEQGFLFE